MKWYGNGFTDQYSRPTPCGIVNNGIYMPVGRRCDNMNSYAPPNIPNQVDVNPSMVKHSNNRPYWTIHWCPYQYLWKKRIYLPLGHCSQNAATLSHQDPIDVAMTKLTSASLQVAACLWDRVVNVTWKELQKELTINFSPLPYDSHASQAFANLIQGPEESLTLYV